MQVDVGVCARTEFLRVKRFHQGSGLDRTSRSHASGGREEAPGIPHPHTYVYGIKLRRALRFLCRVFGIT